MSGGVPPTPRGESLTRVEAIMNDLDQVFLRLGNAYANNGRPPLRLTDAERECLRKAEEFVGQARGALTHGFFPYPGAT